MKKILIIILILFLGVCLLYPVYVWAEENIRIISLENGISKILKNNCSIENNKMEYQSAFSNVKEDACYVDEVGRMYYFDDENTCYDYTDPTVLEDEDAEKTIDQDAIIKLSRFLLAKLTYRDDYVLSWVEYQDTEEIYRIAYTHYINDIETSDFINMSFTADGNLFSYYVSGDSFDGVSVPIVSDQEIKDSINQYMRENALSDKKYEEGGKIYILQDEKVYLQVSIYVESEIYLIKIPLNISGKGEKIENEK